MRYLTFAFKNAARDAATSSETLFVSALSPCWCGRGSDPKQVARARCSARGAFPTVILFCEPLNMYTWTMISVPYVSSRRDESMIDDTYAVVPTVVRLR